MQEIWNLEISIKTLDKIDSESVSIVTGKLIDCVVLKQKRSDFKSVLKTKLNVIQVTLKRKPFLKRTIRELPSHYRN